MREFDGDISKLANHRKTLDVGSHTRAIPLPPVSWSPAIRSEPEHEFRQEYHTGGGVPAAARTVSMPIVFGGDQIKEIITPIIRQHLGRFLGKKLWERLFEMCDGQLPFVLETRPQRLVVIESPFGHPTKVGMEENAAYARRCMLDSIGRGEAPYASHLLYTQCLDDLKTAERKQGMEAGFAWGRVAQHVAVYTDRGVSRGMLEGIKRHQANGKTIEFRSIAQ